MKKVISIFAILFSFFVFSQNQAIVVNYDFFESYNNSINLNSTLKNNGSSSLFEIDDKQQESSNKTSYDNNGNTVLTVHIKKEENRKVYKDFLKNEVNTLVNGFNPNNFSEISEKMPVFNWKIENETQEILGYQCKKATMNFRGRNYIAWFTTKIPVSDGPWKFGGLPGLILKIEDDNSKIKIEANKIVLNTENIDTSFKANKKYSLITWEEYTKKIDKDFNNQIKAYKSKASEFGAEIELDLKFENMEYFSKKDENN
ncbi:GLPGLI family protein [Chryseobacterium shandongense]|nr:GLPGLI family protein [Chryseobacterium shandongense]